MTPGATIAATAWLAVDWGTTRLRAWAMDGQGGVIAERASDDGMARLAPEAFEPALLALVGDLLSDARVPVPVPVPVPVTICGMAGARQGWREAPYRSVPCRLDPSGAVVVPTTDPRLDIRILPGLAQAEPADVMRGEETQLAGFLAAEPGFDGIACLPGTHTKWVRLAAGGVEVFRTAMTGELFALLAEGSVLRHALDDDWDDGAFAEGLAEGGAGALATHLFAIRARSLLAAPAPGVARARLSGLLIGAEIAGLAPLIAAHEVVVIGAPPLAGRYATALAHAARPARILDGGPLVLAGLAAAHRALNRE